MSSKTAPLTRGGHVRDPARQAFQFVTSTVPVIRDDTIIVAATHPNVASARPTEDGWFISDFYAFNYLLKGKGGQQTWLTAADPKTLVQKYGDYLHGNPFMARKVVLSKKLLDTRQLTPVTIVRTAQMITRFLKEVELACNVAKRKNAPLLIMVFCHGLPNHQLLLDNGNSNKGLSIVRLKGVLVPAVSVTFMTTACFSGGWAVSPDFNHTTMAAGGLTGDAALSNAWCNSASVGRACGSIFASSIIESLCSAASPLLEQPAKSTESLQPRSPTRQQTLTYNAFCASIWEMCQSRVHRLWNSQQFTFSAQDDQWEYSWTGRTGIPLAQFEERWKRLADVPYTGPEDVRKYRNPSPFNPTFAGAGKSMSGGHAAQPAISRQHVMQERLKTMAKAFHQTCPGDWSSGQEVGFGGMLRSLYANGEMDRATLLYSTMRYRLELALFTDHVVTRFNLPLPGGETCLSWKRLDWNAAMDKRVENWRQRQSVILDLLTKGGFDFKPAHGQGPPFMRPQWYLAASLIELMGTRDETMAKIAKISEYVASAAKTQAQAVSKEQIILQSGTDWLKTLGKRIRRSLSPQKRPSGGPARRGLFH